MSKPNFELAQNRATEFLLAHKIKGLAIDPREIDLSSEHILIDTIENYAILTGNNINCFLGRHIDDCYVVKARGFKIILYRDSETCTRERKIFGIAHELGHIYCEHTVDDGTSEIEANFFAAQLLMPEIVVYHILQRYNYTRITSEDLVELFGVSHEAARRRIKTFNRKGYWNYNEIDIRLLEKYKPFIEQRYRNDIRINTIHPKFSEATTFDYGQK